VFEIDESVFHGVPLIYLIRLDVPRRPESWTFQGVAIPDQRVRWAGHIGGTEYWFERGHVVKLRRGNHANRLLQGAWNKYGEANFSFHVLQIVDSADDLFGPDGAEQVWLDWGYGFADVKVYNMTHESGKPPSRSGKKSSPETCAKMSASRTGENNHQFGKPHTAETCAKIATALTGRKLSAEHCAKSSAGHKGKKASAEARANMSAAQIGHPGTMLGKHHSDEAKAKQRATKTGENNPMFGKPSPNRGKTPSDETKAKLSDANTGKHPSEETRAKMSAATIGENNPMFGKPASDEQKAAARACPYCIVCHRKRSPNPLKPCKHCAAKRQA
jgi:hypothetical protein